MQTWRWPTDERPGRLKPTEYSSPKPWASASIGRCGLALQSIAAFDTALWDLKARRAGLPLAKLLGAQRDAVPCYNTSGGYLQAPIEEVIELERGVGVTVGQPGGGDPTKLSGGFYKPQT